jgi:predicted  nucleic acid-binding Zn-ribbon protein
MDDIERLKQDAREGRIPADRLVELVVRLQLELQAARRRIEDL